MTSRQLELRYHERLRRRERAILLARKIPPGEIFRMTQAQRTHLAFYPRDQKGELTIPQAPVSLTLRDLPEPSRQVDLAALESMRTLLAEGEYERGLARIEEIWREN